jgi:hypothetical protein
MAIRLTNAAASAAANSTGLKGYIGNTPKISIYEGAVNANAELAPAGNLLATVDIASFGAASNGTITSEGGSDSATDSGEAACFVLYKSDGTTKVLDGSAGEDSGADLVFDEATFVSGGTVAISSFAITVPPA